MSAPAYQAIKDFILERIHACEWEEGDRIPSEVELARKFQVARMTAGRAMCELISERVLMRVRRTGTFVARPKYESTLVEIRSISDEGAEREHQYRARMLNLVATVTDEALAEALQLPAGSPVFHSRMLHFENDEPVQLEDHWVNPSIAPEYALQDFTKTTPNQYLLCVSPPQRVEHRIRAALADMETRRHLTMDELEPCLVLRRRTWSDGVVGSVANLWHSGARYRLTGDF